MNIKEYKSFYAAIGSYPKKNLGQNYLIDKNILHKIGSIAELNHDDLVIEIGTGFGFLTGFLAERVKRVITIEIDKTVYGYAEQKFSELGNVNFINEDALDINFDEIIDDSKFKFISNLPYSVASQIIFGLLDYADSFTNLIIMVQKEMGERICSEPNSKQYGAFSVIVQSYFDAEIRHTVSPNSFWPRPDVDSVIIKMVPREKKIVSDTDRKLFNEVVKRSFHTRRKKMINNLKSLMDQDVLEKIFYKLELNMNTRAEQIGLNNYVALTKEIKKFLN